ncbi:MAG TPA: methyltransferase domain-containing protein [Candidatus Polarisedimenticolia bacterium]|nr:methyltransferase domain-containing protein [Candidatus Polarisedimenticolia bacterium]
MRGMPAPGGGDRFEAWVSALEARHLADLRFPEVRRGLQALSSLYVSRRARLGEGAALDGAGKRAAFALFYAPIHFLLTRAIVRALEAARPGPRSLVDLGCGTGAAGAAWALEIRGRCRLQAIDRSGWAIDEARRTFEFFGLEARAARGSLLEVPLPGRGGAILLAFAANELDEADRGRLLARLLEASGRGAAVLVIEPIARRPASWFGAWRAAFAPQGGRADEWRFPAALPESIRLLDRAAGLDHRELTARSLWLPASRR